MDIKLEPGLYVLAVSGGVDSMVLLDILAKQVTGDRLRATDQKTKNSNPQPVTSNLELVVAHFNHGIRPDSLKDQKLVTDTTGKLDLRAEIGYGNLGPGVSEDKARQARYDFLRHVRRKYRATAIVTAHHQDDLIETAFLNILRGTGPRGVTAIMQNPEVVRPFLNVSKQEIIRYANKNRLEWSEDTTNDDTTYLRNYIRKNLMTQLSKHQRQEMIINIEKVAKSAKSANKLIATISHNIKREHLIDRQQFIQLPMQIGNELIMYWLREQDVRQFDKPTVERLNLAIRTATPNTKHHIRRGVRLVVNKLSAHFETY